MLWFDPEQSMSKRLKNRKYQFEKSPLAPRSFGISNPKAWIMIKIFTKLCECTRILSKSLNFCTKDQDEWPAILEGGQNA